ncbi:MAG: hypothetical protein AAGK09_10500 [Planctomycetota bacterium]
MALLIWGWGTFNRRNITAIRGGCEHCGKTGMLRSYDASRFFSLYFVPLIPTGNRHVIQECPSCKMGSSMSLSEWNRLRRDELEPAIASFVKQPQDRDAAIKAIEASMLLGSADDLRDVADALIEHHVADSELMARVGAACSALCLDQESRAAFDAALQEKDDPAIRTAYACELMQQRRPDLAQPQVDAALAASQDQTGGLLAMLAGSYVAASNPDEAQRTVDRIEQDFPDASKAVLNETRRVRAAIKRLAGRSTSAPPRDTAPDMPKPEGLIRRFAPAMVLPGLVLAVLAVLLAIGLSQKPQHVYLVNGLPVAYDVEVDGKTYSIPANGKRKIDARYGEINVDPVPGGLAVEPIDGEITANPIWRVFDPPTVVINPDRTALLYWESSQYAKRKQDAGPSEFLVHVGEPVYHFYGLDYRFTPLPEQITVEGDRKPWRQTVELLDDFTPWSAFMMLSSETSADHAIAYAKHRLRLEPENSEAVHLGATVLPTAEAMSELAALLDRRPVLVEVHRIYQNMAEVNEPQRDLEAEYAALLDVEPQNADLLYLAGRIESEPAEATALFERGMAAPTPSGYAFHGRAYQQMVRGDFTGAWGLCQRAQELLPVEDHPALASLGDSVRFAGADRPGLLADLQRQIDEEPLNGFPVDRAIHLLHAMDRPVDARAMDREYLARLAADETVEQADVAYWATQFAAAHAIAAGDLPGYAAIAEQDAVDERMPIDLAMALGEWHEAADRLRDTELGTAQDWLLIYAGATQADLPSLAAEAMEEARTRLAAGRSEDRALAAWCGGDPIPRDVASRLVGDSAELAKVYVALAALEPGRANEFNGMARRHNYDPWFGYLAVRRLTEPGPTTASR